MGISRLVMPGGDYFSKNALPYFLDFIESGGSEKEVFTIHVDFEKGS